MANSRSVLLRLTGDSGDARRALSEVRSDLRRMSREEARVRVDIQTARVERQIDAVRERLQRLAQQSPSPEVDLKTARAREKLALLEFKLDRLSLKKVNIDVDVKRGGLERAAAGLGSLERGAKGVSQGIAGVFQQVPILGGLLSGVLGGAFSLAENLGTALGSLVTRGLSSLLESFGSLSGMASPIGQVTGSLVSLGASLVGLAAVGGAVVIALNAILGAVVALGGAVIALLGSLTAAAAGLGAMAVAIGGVLLPVLVVGIGLFQRFQAIIQARKAHEQELTQAIQQQKTAEHQRAAALQTVKQAEQQLADATVAGRHAMAQAAVDERNAELALQDSQLGVKGARLGVLEAKKALQDLLKTANVAGPTLNSLVKKFSSTDFDPSNLGRVAGAVRGAGGHTQDPLAVARAILNVQQAQQGVKDAVNQTANAEDRLRQATKTRIDFARRGLDAYKPYRTALAAVSRAEGQLARATDRTSAAHAKYERALRGLTGTERGTLSRLDDFIAKFKELAKAVSDPVFRALNDAFDTLKGTGGGFKDALVQIGNAMGDVIRSFARFLADPATQGAFRTLAAGAARLIREIGSHAFISFLTIMRTIATAALPAVESAARGVSTWLGRIAGQPDKIRHAVGFVISQFRAWLRLAGSVLGLIAQIFVPAAKSGRSLADSMRHVVDHWRDLIRADPSRVSRFFRNAVEETKKIAHWIGVVVRWLKNNLPRAAETAKEAFKQITPVLKDLLELLKDFNDLSGSGIGKLLQPLAPRQSSGGLHGAAPAPKGFHYDLSTGRLERNRTPDRRSPDARTSSLIGNVHITVPGGGSPDPRTLAAKLERELRLAG